MDPEERAILATLAYYDALRWPLTLLELSERLLPPARFEGARGALSLDELSSYLSRLVVAGRIRVVQGLYALTDETAGIIERRISRQAVSAEKWRAMLRSAWWFQAVPFVRMMSASGSLASGSSGPQSDWDMFIVVRSGRLYTARLGLLLVAWGLRRLRTKHMRSAPDLFCFNHLITTDGLAMRHRGIYTAHAYAWLLPFYDPWGYAGRFKQANAWILQYSSTSFGATFVRRSFPRSRLLGALRWLAELLLTTFFGRIVESLLRRWMQGRIRANPETHQRGGRIVADDRELEFHPHSFETTVLARYATALIRLGMGKYSEHDSGLLR